MSSLSNGFLASDTRRGWARTGAALLVLVAGLALLMCSATAARAGKPATPNLRARVAQLEAQVAALQAALDAVEETLAPFSAVADGTGGYDVYLEPANLHIRNGLGATNGYPANPGETDPRFTATNGLGNLFIGYNELGGVRTEADRTGSHNLVVGPEHGYTSYGGLIIGLRNYVSRTYSSVSGGCYKTASSWCSSVTGGHDNSASGPYSTVSGGYQRSAVNPHDWRAGGLWQNN